MMQNLKFIGLDEELKEPVKLLQSQLGFTFSDHEAGGTEVTVSRREKGLQVTYDQGKAWLSYHNKNEFFRGLGFLTQAINNGRDTVINEEPSFTYLSYMQDNSRNAVSNIRALEKLIRQLALMGYTSLMLYTEDTYEIEGYPYFGYQRGRFSKAELMHLNSYGQMFGIEMVPCIQTLAHLNAIFQWGVFSGINDTGDILLCGEEKTYALIEAMIRTFSEAFTSRRINIGMDEAEMLGRGKFLNLNGYTQPADIMEKHLKKVLEICRKYGMQAMMWSDMFFKMLPDNTEYYNITAEIPQQIKDKIPEDVELVYWDYYSRDKKIYDNMMKRHKQLSDRVGFAGGAWKWQGFAPLLHHSMMVSEMALQSCLENNINDIIVTGWGDNGGETSNFAVGPVLQLYAEACYNGNMSKDFISSRLLTCTNMDMDDFMKLDLVNLTPDNPSPGLVSSGPVKYLFYQDILQGLYDRHVDDKTYPAHYRECHRLLSEIAAKNQEYSYIFDSLAKLSQVVELKCDLGIRLKDAYDAKNTADLKKIAEVDCEELLRRIEVYHGAFRRQWYLENKPFGFDAQDLRIGGLKERVKAVIWSIESFLRSDISRIEELEQERLTINGSSGESEPALLQWQTDWRRMVTASVL